MGALLYAWGIVFLRAFLSEQSLDDLNHHSRKAPLFQRRFLFCGMSRVTAWPGIGGPKIERERLMETSTLLARGLF